MSDTLQNKYRTGDLAGTKERTYRLGSVANGQNGGFFQYNRYFLSHRPHTIDEIRISATEQLVTETHTHTDFRVDVGKSRKHAEKDGWPEGRQACNGRKIKNKLRQARRTCSPLQHAARTGASCREAILGPTQRRLGRPEGEHENGRPTRK